MAKRQPRTMRTFSDIISGTSNSECCDLLYKYLQLKQRVKKEDQEIFKTAETFMCEKVISKVAIQVKNITWNEIINRSKKRVPWTHLSSSERIGFQTKYYIIGISNYNDESYAIKYDEIYSDEIDYPSEIELKQAKLIN